MSDEIRKAMEQLLASPGRRAAILSQIELRLQEMTRLVESHGHYDARYGGMTRTVVNTDPEGRYSAIAGGEVVDWQDPSRMLDALDTFGMPVTYTPAVSIYTRDVEITRTAKGGLTDHPSRVVPLVTRTIGVADGDQLAGMRDPERMRATLATFGYTPASQSAVWTAIARIRREGFAGIPFNPVAAARARDAAHRLGMHWHLDRLDDVISDATERAHASLTDLVTRASTGDAGVVPLTVFVAAPSDDIPVDIYAGFYVTRAVRCGQCRKCQKSSDTASRYSVASCLSPQSIVEYTTPARTYSRALYAAASASMSNERYSEPRAHESLPTVAIDDHTSRDCGHGSTCRRPACAASNIIRAAIVLCEATGAETVSRNGAASIPVMNMLAPAFGNAPSAKGRRYALDKIRGMATRPAGRPDVSRPDLADQDCNCFWSATTGARLRRCIGHASRGWRGTVLPVATVAPIPLTRARKRVVPAPVDGTHA